MKAISLLQPWASLVVVGVKTIETRSWQTLHRGELLIHASLGQKGRVFCGQPPFNRFIQDFQKLPFGAIIGSVTLQDIVPVESLQILPSKLAARTLEGNAFGNNTKGRYAWIFSDPKPFEQIIWVKGSLHLWNYMPV